jgi:hypothetical protein
MGNDTVKMTPRHSTSWFRLEKTNPIKIALDRPIGRP